MIKRALLLVAIAGLCSPAWSQAGRDDGVIGWGAYGGAGKVVGGGGFVGWYKTGPLRRVLNSGAFADVGILGTKHSLEGVLSVNYQTTYTLHRDQERPGRAPEFFYLTGGYSRFVQTGNAANYGIGFLIRSPGHDSAYNAVRIEYREHWIPGWGRQPAIRLAYEWDLAR
jgi:hypothetical protein